MSAVNLPGGFFANIGPQMVVSASPAVTSVTIDAANEAMICIGRIKTSDGGSHTLNTTGSSKIEWRTDAVTFANAGTTLKVGLAAVDTSNGPPGRAVNAANVVTFDVSRSMIGGGGEVTTTAWQSHVPDTGTKTIADGDLVAFVVQMTARAGADSVLAHALSVGTPFNRPSVTGYTGGTYADAAGFPDCFITFADGATGWFYASDVHSIISTRTYNSGSSPNEYGQLFVLPFPVRILGAYGHLTLGNDCDLVLYSDPLGTPVAQRTVSFDANTVATASARRVMEMFATPYDVAANQPIAIVAKPTTASNVSAFYKTLANAAHRIADPWGTSGYGVSRASGAFANANSSLDHYYLGLLASGFDAGGAPFTRLQLGM